MATEGAVSAAAPAPVDRIPFSRPDLPAFEDVADQIREILESRPSPGARTYVSQVEEAASAYLGAHVVAISSGTMALLFTLQALGLQPGQRVILPSLASVATLQAIRYAGGVPAFAEIGGGPTLSPADLEMLLAKHHDVGAVVPVHTYGMPCTVDEIEQAVRVAARRLGRPIPIVYDAAHALGSWTRGRPVGVFGNAEVFSLATTMPLTSIEGGLVASHKVGLIRRLKKMRDYGLEAHGLAYWPGLNGKMSEVHAIIGLSSFRRLPELLAQRRAKGQLYADRIDQTTSFRVICQPISAACAFKGLAVAVPAEHRERRDSIVAALSRRGIESRLVCHPPLHQQPLFRKYADRPLPRTEDLSQRVIVLPFYTSMTEAHIEYVVAALREADSMPTCCGCPGVSVDSVA